MRGPERARERERESKREKVRSACNLVHLERKNRKICMQSHILGQRKDADLASQVDTWLELR